MKKSDDQMYGDARMQRLAELKKLIHQLMAKGKGDDPSAMGAVTAELGDPSGADDGAGMVDDPADDTMDPKKAALRAYFKPKAKPSRPGTGAFIAGAPKMPASPAKKPNPFAKGKMG